jgi:hypothetical protein
MTAEEFGAALFALERRDYEEFVAKYRGLLELAEAENRPADAAWYREMIAGHESIPKPWERAASAPETSRDQ